MADPKVRADRSLAPALVAAYEESQHDPKVRQYLALALGRLDPPLSPRAVASLTKALDDPESDARLAAIWALGSSGDPAVAASLRPHYESQDAGIRKMVVYALGALPGDAQVQTLRVALEDASADVRWNAAVALARHNKADGLPVIRQMLDRAHVEGTVKREVATSGDFDPVSEVMISAVRAAGALKDGSLRVALEGLSRGDQSLKVRQAALDALKQMGGSASN
jgi:HEAT repeat protein